MASPGASRGEASQSRMLCSSSQALKPAMTKATAHASVVIHAEFVNSPILRRSLVNIASGNTAKLSSRLSTTGLSTSRRYRLCGITVAPRMPMAM
jgi:hypothetical protein